MAFLEGVFVGTIHELSVRRAGLRPFHYAQVAS